MTPMELAAHIDRIIVAPIGKLNLVEAAAMVRAALHPPGARALGWPHVRRGIANEECGTDGAASPAGGPALRRL